MFEEFDLKRKDKYYLLFITVFSTILVGYYINFNMKFGINCSDVYIYLLNALYFTGTNIHSDTNIHLSPIICFLTSLLFRIGIVNQLAIYIVTGIFAIIGNIGLYLLFKQYFDENLSLLGTIMFSTSTLSLVWLANGTLDIPAVGLTVWAVFLSILAIDKNPKYYKYAISIFVLGIFTRYTVVLTIPALLLYYVFKKGFKIKSEDKQQITKGIIIGVVLAAIIFSSVFIMGSGHFGAGSQMANGISGKQGSDSDPAYVPEYDFYLVNFPNYISNSHTYFDGNPVLENVTPLSWAIFVMLLAGIVIWLIENKIKIDKTYAIPVILFAIAIVTYTRISSVITILLVLAGLYLLGKDSDYQTEYFMLGWILANFIFYSYYSIKVNRYILPAFPAFIFFVLKSIDIIQNRFKINKNIIPIILIACFIIQGFAFVQTIEQTDVYKNPEEISNYIKDIDPNYENVEIATYNLRPYSWWLGANVSGIYVGDKEKIEQSNATYYIANTNLTDLENFTEIKNIGNLYLYKHKSV